MQIIQGLKIQVVPQDLFFITDPKGRIALMQEDSQRDHAVLKEETRLVQRDHIHFFTPDRFHHIPQNLHPAGKPIPGGEWGGKEHRYVHI